MAEQDTLEGGARRSRRGLILAVVLVAALAGWLVLRPDADPAPIAAAPTSTAPASPAVPEADGDPSRRTLDQVTFLDERTAFALRLDCSRVNSEGYCPRSLLASADGGLTWAVRSDLPPVTDGFRRLQVDSAEVLAVVDDATLSRLSVSTDGGRTWQQEELRRGDNAATPRRTSLVLADSPCPSPCPTLVWVDLATATLHPLPAQPSGDGYWRIDGTGTRSDRLLSATDLQARVAVSADGGRGWSVTQLPVQPAAGEEIGETVVRSGAAGSPLYAFVQLNGLAGLSATVGFRSTDEGRTWTDISFEGRITWLPAGVIDGELIATNLQPGGVYLSERGGTRFGTVLGTPIGMFLSQGDPGRPVFGTVFDQEGRSTYWVSVDGRDWRPVLLPLDQ